MKKVILNIFLFSIGMTTAAYIVGLALKTFVPPHVLHPSVKTLQIKEYYQEQANKLETDLMIQMQNLETIKAKLERTNTMFGNYTSEDRLQVSIRNIDRLLSDEAHGKIKNDPRDHYHKHESVGGTIILFAFSTLLIGSILREVKKKTGIPYTPMVLIAGAFLGYYSHFIPFIGNPIETVAHIDAHTLLMIFIPGLVFEGAYNTDGYTFNKSKWQVLMMAGPGVLITSVVIAYTLMYLFGYSDEISMGEALVIG